MQTDQNITGFVFTNEHIDHASPWDNKHPECPGRIEAVYNMLINTGIVKRLKHFESVEATKAMLLLNHKASYIKKVQSSQHMSFDRLRNLSAMYDGVYFSKGTYSSACYAIGSQIQLLKAINNGQVLNGIALTRPPNHHALREHASGFCIFNGVAISAKFALKNFNVKRIAIIDWDIHHGQGTQQSFYDDPRVLVISIHRYEQGNFWPNLRSGDYDYIGEGGATGYNINLPIDNADEANNDIYLTMFLRIVIPILSEFKPEMIFVSHGSDSNIGDPEGGCMTTPGLFAHLISMLQSIQPRLMVFMEGGYNAISIEQSVLNITKTLLGDSIPFIRRHSPLYSKSVLDSIRVLRPFWRCLQWQEKTHKIGKSEYEGTKKQHCSGDEIDYEHYESSISPPYNLDHDYTELSAEVQRDLNETLKAAITSETLPPKPHRLAIIYDERVNKHNRTGHPEFAGRVSSIYSGLKSNGILEKSSILEPRNATDEEMFLAHSEEHINFLKEITFMDHEEMVYQQNRLDSIYLTRHVYESARMACGCLLQIVDKMFSREYQHNCQTGFAVIRPPGHHAYRNKASGFCFVNNVAVAARYAIKNFSEVNRVLIFDWDIHHGNGTQEIFYKDSNVLYISVHREAKFYPRDGSNTINATGEGRGRGFNVNISWNKAHAKELGDVAYMEAVRQIVMPIAYEFGPDLVIVSSGFDAGISDPLGDCKVSYRGFGLMTHELKRLAGGNIILALEGGYNVETITESAVYCCSSLLGDMQFIGDTINENEILPESVIQDLTAVINIQKNFWKCFNKVKMPNNVDTLKWLGKPIKYKHLKGSFTKDELAAYKAAFADFDFISNSEDVDDDGGEIRSISTQIYTDNDSGDESGEGEGGESKDDDYSVDQSASSYTCSSYDAQNSSSISSKDGRQDVNDSESDCNSAAESDEVTSSAIETNDVKLPEVEPTTFGICKMNNDKTPSYNTSEFLSFADIAVDNFTFETDAGCRGASLLSSSSSSSSSSTTTASSCCSSSSTTCFSGVSGEFYDAVSNLDVAETVSISNEEGEDKKDSVDLAGGDMATTKVVKSNHPQVGDDCVPVLSKPSECLSKNIQN